MKSRFILLVGMSALGACALPDSLMRSAEEPTPGPEQEAVSIPELAAPPPPTNARTVEQFDTTTEEQRVAAASGGAGGALLGRSVAVLGDPAKAGFWLETPLANTRSAGRVVSVSTGEAAEVELIPAADGNARLSLAAMRLLGVALTDLVEVEVYEAK